MAKGLYGITLSDGIQLTVLALNGNNFISNTEVTKATFAGKLKHVVIAGDKDADMEGLIGEYENMELIRSSYNPNRKINGKLRPRN